MNFMKIGIQSPVFRLSLFFSLSACSLLVAEQKLFAIELRNKVAADVIKLEPNDNDAFIRGKEVSMRSFHQAYSGYTADQLYLENKPGFLQGYLEASYEDEETDFYGGKEGSLFTIVRNTQNNEII